MIVELKQVKEPQYISRDDSYYDALHLGFKCGCERAIELLLGNKK